MNHLDNLIIQEYSSQTGSGGLPYFVGKQYGTGWLRNIARFAFPFVKKALGFVGNIAGNTAEDVINNENRSVGDALKQHASAEVNKVLKRKAAAAAPQSSSINRGKKKSVSATKRRRKLII